MKDKIIESIKELNKGSKDTDPIISGFDKFEKMKNELIMKLNTEKVIGNTTSDLGNFIGQVIYKFLDDDLFSEEDFIGGFEHGIDSMKEPSKSKWHNFDKF